MSERDGYEFSVGDLVTVTGMNGVYVSNCGIVWTDRKNEAVGKTFRVRTAEYNTGQMLYTLDAEYDDADEPPSNTTGRPYHWIDAWLAPACPSTPVSDEEFDSMLS